MAFEFKKKSLITPTDEKDIDPRLVGWLVYWKMRRNPAGYPCDQVFNEFQNAGLPPVRIKMRKSAAVRKALRLAAKNKTLTPLVDNKKIMKFQISLVDLEDDAKYGKVAKYIRDSVVTYHYDTGQIECDRSEVRDFVVDKFNLAISNYTTSQISILMKKLFNIHAGIATLNDGLYIVPAKYKPYLDAAKKFMAAIGNRLSVRPEWAEGDVKQETREDVKHDLLQQIELFKEYFNNIIEENKNRDPENKLSDSARSENATNKKIIGFKKKIKMWEASLRYKLEDVTKMLDEIEKRKEKFFGTGK